jgi:hypothetical protein
VREASLALAKTVEGKSAEDGAKALFRRTLLRDPSADELAVAVKLVRPRDDAPLAWELLAQALLVSNEFLFLN